ncbi:MAG TPA: hypothetical protein VHO46_04010 [Bacteroidales bacterium]|nr:hypothetical protein [Bacteroidales bacterium]
MGKAIYVLLVVAGVGLFSCKSGDGTRESDNLAENTVMQRQDGTISLEVRDADTYHDVNEPQSSTAEWNVVVSKSGRYNVWLSSATKDSTKLRYNNPVMLSIKDDMLEVRPSVDKVIQNPSDVSYPYYKADSFVGSLYLKDTGVYNIQVVSDRIVPSDDQGDQTAEDTKLLSVSLKPAE